MLNSITMIKKLLLSSFILITTSTLCSAKDINLLSIPLDDGTHFDYNVVTQKKCSFEGVTEITYPSFEEARKTNFVLDKLSYFQKKLNLEIEKQEITPKKITFSLKGSENIYYEFFYKKHSIFSSKCDLVKIMNFNNKPYNVEEVDVDYSTILSTPVIEKVTIKNAHKNNDDLNLYPWQLKGQMPVYEFKIGPALNIHTNIRLDNINKFEKNNPVVEPIPAFFFRYGPFFVNKDGLGSLVYSSGDFTVLAMGILEGEPYKAEGLHEREKGLFFGSIVKYHFAEFIYYNDFLKDKGFNLKLNLAPEYYHTMAWKFVPQAYIQYWDRTYTDYYFGVKNNEVSTKWKAYEGKPSINYGGMFEANHFIKQWQFIVSTGVKFYGKEVYTSPTVTKKAEFRFITSVLYKLF